jgi:hypothetical protein
MTHHEIVLSMRVPRFRRAKADAAIRQLFARRQLWRTNLEPWSIGD